MEEEKAVVLLFAFVHMSCVPHTINKQSIQSIRKGLRLSSNMIKVGEKDE